MLQSTLFLISANNSHERDGESNSTMIVVPIIIMEIQVRTYRELRYIYFCINLLKKLREQK